MPAKDLTKVSNYFLFFFKYFKSDKSARKTLLTLFHSNSEGHHASKHPSPNIYLKKLDNRIKYKQNKM